MGDERPAPLQSVCVCVCVCVCFAGALQGELGASIHESGSKETLQLVSEPLFEQVDCGYIKYQVCKVCFLHICICPQQEVVCVMVPKEQEVCKAFLNYTSDIG